MSGDTEERSAPDAVHVRRKRIMIDYDKLARVVALLGARPESEAIDRLLDQALFRGDLLASVDEIAGIGGMENYFPGGYAEQWAAERG